MNQNEATTITLRIDKTSKKLIKEYSKERGISVSSLIKFSTLKAIKKDVGGSSNE